MSIRSTNPTDYINNNTDSPNRIIHELRNIDRTLKGAEGAIEVTASITGSPNVFVTNGAGNPVPVSFAAGGLATETTLSNLNNKVSSRQFLYQKAINRLNGEEAFIRTIFNTDHNVVIANEVIDKLGNIISSSPNDYYIGDDLLKTEVIEPTSGNSLTATGDVVDFIEIPRVYNSGYVRMRYTGSTFVENARVDILSEDDNGNKTGIPYERSVTYDKSNGVIEVTLKFNLLNTRNLFLVLKEDVISTGYDRIFLILSTSDISVDDNIVRSEEAQIDINDFENRYTRHRFLDRNYTEKQLFKSLLSFIGGQSDTTVINELTNINNKLAPTGISVNAGSSPVVMSSEQTQDLMTTHTPTNVLGENLFINGSGASSFDTLSNGTSYREFAIQVISAAGTLGGAIIFEGSNDNFSTTAIPLSIFDDTTNTGVVLSGAITITQNTIRYFVGETAYRYVRCRISTAPTGTSTLRAITKWGIVPSTHRTVVVAQPTASNLQCTASMTIAGTALNGNAIPAAGTTTRALPVASVVLSTNADANSLARTSSGNSGTVSDDYGHTIASVINVTATSGTGQTMDIALEQSSDGGTTWQAIYHVRRISSTGAVTIPKMKINGRRRWSWIIAGTSPSFTFSITSSRPQVNADTIRNFFDRTITATLNATSAAFDIEETKCTVFYINSGAATTPGSFQLQVTNDVANGWANIGSPIASVASTMVTSGGIAVNAKFARIICTSAGTAQTINYVNINSIS